jgi:hypothetical protein
VVEIYRSRELGGSQGESLRIERSKSREVKSRGAWIAIGSRSQEECWIRNPITFRISRVHRSEGFTFDCKGREVPRVEVSRGHEAELHSEPRNLTNGHTSRIGRSQYPIDLLHIWDSVDKGTNVRASNS